MDAKGNNVVCLQNAPSPLRQIQAGVKQVKRLLNEIPYIFTIRYSLGETLACGIDNKQYIVCIVEPAKYDHPTQFLIKWYVDSQSLTKVSIIDTTFDYLRFDTFEDALEHIETLEIKYVVIIEFKKYYFVSQIK